MAPAALDPTSFDEATDAELLAHVARAGGEARAAQAALYARHVRYLYGALLRQKNGLLRAAGTSAEDMVQETFHRAFEKAHTFQAGESGDADRERARTRAWLGRIANNLLLDLLAGQREVAATPYLDRVTCDAIDEEPPSSRSPKARLVGEGLEQLSERERDVLAVSAAYYRAGDHQRLPNEASAELAGRWGTTNENIRAIRARAMKKLKAFLATRGLSILWVWP